MEAFERSVLIYPGFQENWYMLGRCAQLLSDNKRAEQAYEKSINDFSEKKIESYYNLGSLYKQSGEYKKAIANFQEANKKQEDFNGANGAIGECYLQLGNWKEAGTYLNKAYHAHPDDKVVLNNLGVMEYSLQHYAAAEKYFSLSVKADSCFLDGLKNTAACCQVLNKRQEAMTYYERAIQCHPEQLTLYEALIALYTQTGNTAKAEQYQKMLTERKKGM
jgi:tetratricopeptide (TPR) repeat protein